MSFRTRIIPFLAIPLAFFASQLKATPYVYGYSTISVSASVVNMWCYTEVDYATAYGYSVETDVFPNGTGSGYDATGAPYVGQGATLTAAANQSYWVQTNHWILTSGSDPDGFGGISPQYWPNSMTVAATGTPGGAGPFAVGYTYASTDTYGSAPTISGVDQGSYGNAQAGTTGYAIVYGDHLTATWASSGAATQVSIPGITTAVTYEGVNQVNVYYSIPAGTPAGPLTGTLTTPYGTATFTFTVNPSSLLSQTISFPALSAQTVGSPVTVSATASSGLPVSFSSDTSGVCTVSGSVVSPVAVGTCTVRARQTGSATYAAAPEVTQSFAVTAATGGSGTPYKEYIRLNSRVIAVETAQTTTGGGLTVSASPASGSGSSGSFTFSASNSGVSSGLTGITILINTGINGSNACWMHFESGALSLANDAGSSWSGTLSNSQCSISSVADLTNSSSLGFSASISFSGSFTGTKSIYMYTANTAGANTGYLLEGSWTVTAAGLTVSASPTSGSGWSQTFTFAASDSGSSASVTGMTILINSSINGSGACWLYFDHSGLSLANDAGSAWSGTLSNSQCSLASVATLTNSSSLSFSAAITFTSGFAGTRDIYMYAGNTSGGSIGYVSRATWTVP